MTRPRSGFNILPIFGKLSTGSFVFFFKQFHQAAARRERLEANGEN
jgi:hypothetical protein